jgi:hypothetical protein
VRAWRDGPQGEAHLFEASDRVKVAGDAPGPLHRTEQRLQRDSFFDPSGCRAPALLEVKVGAQVMLTVNETAATQQATDPSLRLANGSRGVVVGFATPAEYRAEVKSHFFVGCPCRRQWCG